MEYVTPYITRSGGEPRFRTEFLILFRKYRRSGHPEEIARYLAYKDLCLPKI